MPKDRSATPLDASSALSTSTANSSGIAANFEKLSGISNYVNWKFLMRMYLVHEDLWDCIEESAHGVPKVTDGRKQLRALAKICLMVHPSSFAHVRNATTGFEAWNNLKKAYEDKGLCRRLGLLRTLFGLKLEQFENMEAYLLKITELDQQLRDINAPLDDDFLSVVILSGLPPDYDPLIMALENSNIKLCSEIVKGKLLQENLRRDFEKCEENALFTNRVKNEKRNFSKVRCFICKKPNHYAKNCPTKINKKERRCDKYEKAWNGTLLTALSVDINSNAWYIDSGATCHMTNNKSLLQNYSVHTPKLVTVANNNKMYSEGHGDVEILLKGHTQPTKLIEVIYVPGLSTNLISVGKMASKGLEVQFDSNKCNIYCNKIPVASASRINGVYQLDTATQHSVSIVQPEIQCKSNQHAETVNLCEIKPSQELWHRRLGHLNRRSMELLRQGMASGINYTVSDYTPCVACLKGKQSRLPFPKQSYTRATEKLGLIHSDLCGPMSVNSFSGAKYLLTFIDDYTRMTFGYFIRNKSEVLPVFKIFKKFVENQTNLKIKMLRTDNGREYVNKDFQLFLQEHGIKHQTTVPYSPQQNGVAERANRTIIEAGRCMLQEAGLDRRFWAEALNTAIYIKNKSPSKAVRGTTPEEKWSGNKVNLSNLRTFGCVAYAMIPNEKRKKLDAKCKQYIFVGYCSESKGYRLIDPENPSKCIKSRDVQFLEGKMYKNLVLNKGNKTSDCELNISSNEDDLNSNDINDQVNPTSVIESSDSNSADTSASGCSFIDDPDDVTWNPDMTLQQSSDSDDTVSIAVAMTACHNGEPQTIQDALSGPDAEHWRKAIADEYKSFEKNKAWNLTLLPAGKKAVKCKWVFKKKLGSEGELLHYKARLVAKGFTQEYGIDYKETYSPVVRYSTIRTLIALAVNLDLYIDHMDVKTAFLNGDLRETVYMVQPDGYKVKGKENYVFKLNKAIYGLKQASKAWYDKIDSALTDLQFRKTLSEPCVYIRSDAPDNLIILALYVDDILIFSKDSLAKTKLKEELMKKFEMKDLGRATHVLGMRLNQQENKITLDQRRYIEKVLEQFNMADCKPVSTPLECGLKLEKGDQTELDSKYRSLVGCIMYIAVCTRPDIAHAASLLSQFNNCHSDTHWKAAKRVLRYLKGTIDYKIVYEKSSLCVTGYVDADWASNQLDRRSYTGYVFKIGNSAVSWESRKQRTVALSSTEAEYMALCEGAKEAQFIRSFVYECLGTYLSVTLYNDSQSAQKICNSQINHSRSKHIDIRHHYVKQIVKDKIVKLEYLATEYMPADVLTKCLSKDKHSNCISHLGLQIV
ncbi:Retrovirus-related Pol polyprotein from transposon TNT 1-94 [Papilio machaon]|uniref:Retrovirus-related Pol polyprotein from transposon TNT 1-94 n=1 Tax=Papilio machaon TaxID=76193 RepID=A0A0N1ICY1_PAPMA|nr:Retrovirus-related Pol polyprotein from transposon TNT 1-94 [Papilio machaon]